MSSEVDLFCPRENGHGAGIAERISKLEAWLGEGEQICIEKRGQPIAMLTPVDAAAVKKVKMPNFAARRRGWTCRCEPLRLAAARLIPLSHGMKRARREPLLPVTL